MSGPVNIGKTTAPKIVGAINWHLVALPIIIVGLLLAMLSKGAALVITDVLIMVLFASSLNFIISFGGMVSFGHAAYFGLGAYGLALSVAKFGLPVWSGFLMGPIIATFAALAFGALCVRLSHIYFAMLTLACGEITYTILFQAYDYTGGDNGITNFMVPSLGLDPRLFGLAVLIVVTTCLVLMWRVVNSPFGLVIRAVGEEPHRAAALGYSPRTVNLLAFSLAGLFAGIAGALFACQQGNAFPEYAGLTFAIEALVMVVIGGLRSFSGGIYGAVVYTLLKTFLPRYTGVWELVIGIILIVIVLAFPQGCSGGLKMLRKMWGGKAE